jgi:hypothetical protein
MDKKLIIFLLVILFVSGSVFGCSGWRTDETGTYYNVYNENGTLNKSVYIDVANNTTIQKNITKNEIYLDEYKTT